MRALLLSVVIATAGFAAIGSEAGLSGSRKPIQVFYGDSALDYATRKHRVLIVGGLDGSEATAALVRQQMEWFEKSSFRGRYALAAIPLGNPDAVKLVFPPPGEAYAAHTESHVLWRFTMVFAPDLLVIAGPDPGQLAKEMGPAQVVAAERGFLQTLLGSGLKPGVSAARAEMRSRLARKPVEVARQLAVHYGHELPQAVYIPAVALIGRLRLGALADIERIVEPYVTGAKDSLDKPSASHLSGHLVFAELAARTGKGAYLDRVKAAAAMGFTPDGQMKEAMPLHNEMSDAFFMGCPILAAAGKLTGEARYYDMCLRHMRFMEKLDLRADGLYRHSPLDEAAWGRGNGFPALGLAWSLDSIPKSHPGHGEMLASFQRHMKALLPHQEMTGAWRQVIDLPGSYRELTATCMIGVAMLRGIRKGWLPAATYRPAVKRAWEAVKLRVGVDGKLIDVCTSTGKQPSLEHYLDRVAILGADPRGGAMALLFATEMAGL
jgi:unsaturated rhamnogalacturonyl hydrolase